MSTDLRGSFLGFTYNGIHSSTLGITRVITSNRMNENLTPSMSASAVSGDGGQTYYFGSTYTKRDLSLSIAFDNLTDTDIRNIQNIMNDKQIHTLIFDESPYKIWSAKPSGSSLIKHLAFEDTVNSTIVRHYRGEGTLVFTCYFPFARSRYAYQEDYTLVNIPEWVKQADLLAEYVKYGLPVEVESNPAKQEDFDSQASGPTNSGYEEVLATESVNSAYYTNILTNSVVDNNENEWLAASGIPSRSEYGTWSNNALRLYNAGDVPMYPKFWYSIDTAASASHSFCLSMGDSELELTSFTTETEDKYLMIDMYEETIMGYDSAKQSTGNLYNGAITDGGFFTVPVGAQILSNSSTGLTPLTPDITYLYL